MAYEEKLIRSDEEFLQSKRELEERLDRAYSLRRYWEGMLSAAESFWRGESSEMELKKEMKEVDERAVRLARDAENFAWRARRWADPKSYGAGEDDRTATSARNEMAALHAGLTWAGLVIKSRKAAT